MIAAEDDGDDALGRHRAHGVLERGEGLLGLPRRHLDVAEVHHAEIDQRVDVEGEVRPHPVVREVVGDPDRLRAEPAAGAV